MKKFQSYNQFEAEWKKESIPEMDLGLVKSKVIGLDNCNKQTYKKKPKVALVVAVAIFTLCFATVVMAIFNGWQLKNNKGDVLLNFVKGEIPEMNKIVRGVNARLEFYEVEDEILESLAPGDMAYFLVVKEYEISKYLPVLQKEERITDMQKLKESTITKFKIPEYLPDSYKFEYGIITYKAEGENQKLGEALYQEAKKADKKYIIQKGKLTREAKEIKLKYVNKDGYKLTIYVSGINDLKLFGYDHKDVEKLTVSNKELLYIGSKWGEVDSYIFVDEQTPQNLTYQITNNGMNEVIVLGSSKNSLPLPKEEAIKMIESFK